MPLPRPTRPAADAAPARSAAVTAIGGPDAVLDQLERVLLGKRAAIELALACLLARGHLLIEDVPGVGKTTLARALGATLGLDWTRVQFTNDLLPADVVGVSVFDRDSGEFRFRPGPVFTSILLADEINRAPPKAQSALLEAMEERQVSVDGQTHPLPEDFFVIATQNPAEQLGAFPLPESQLDRFLVGLSIGLPDPVTERELLEHGDRRRAVEALDPVVNPLQLKAWSREVDAVHVDPLVFDYLHALVRATRPGGEAVMATAAGGAEPPARGEPARAVDEAVRAEGPAVPGLSGPGLSPRAGIALVALARAFAWLGGRDHVLPEDVQAVFPALAGHRLTGHVASGARVARAVLERVRCP